KALAQTLRRPGLDIFQTFNEVGLVVKRTTKGVQQPWVSSSPIAGSFYFAGVAATAPAPAPSPPVPRIDPCAAAEAHWKSAETIATRAAFEDHLARFSGCAFAGLAKAKIEALKKQATGSPSIPEPPPPKQNQPGLLGGLLAPLFGRPST